MLDYGEFQRELLPGEKVLWSGRPPQGTRFHVTDIFAIPFSLAWAGFAVFWEVGVLRSNVPGFALIGAPFVVVGAHITVGRFIVDAYTRSGTQYLLTDSRALILSSWPRRSLRSVTLADLSLFSFSERADGTGTLFFGSREYGRRGPPRTPRFEGVDDARRVYELALSARSGQARKPF